MVYKDINPYEKLASTNNDKYLHKSMIVTIPVMIYSDRMIRE